MSLPFLLVLLILVAGVAFLAFALARPHLKPQQATRDAGARARTPTPQPTPSTGGAPLPDSQAELVALEGPERGQTFLLSIAETPIGRGSENSLQLAGFLVSRKHALIAYQDRQYTLYDRESANGTFVNGRRIAQHPLRSGDRIQIGPTVLEFRSGPLAAPSEGDGAASGAYSTPPLAPGRVPPQLSQLPQLRGYELYPIKQGGASIVFKGVRRGDQQAVAIKVLRQVDPYVEQKFKVEARILRSLHHPHVAHAYDFGEQDGLYFIIMEYCPDGTLRDRLRPGQPLPLDPVASIVGQVCEGLDYAHRHGVVHRDIKPENIMFSGGVIKLVDFGIAKLTGAVTRTMDGMIIGTPYYLSYEQARGQLVDHRSDIYSLGVVLYEMVTGRVPFDGQSTQIIQRHLKEAPVPPRRLNPALPSSVEAIVLRCLHKDRTQRFQSAGDLAAALGATTAAPVVRTTPPALPRSTSSAVGLIYLTGPRRGQSVRLAAGINPLDRRSLAPEDTRMSRQHAQIIIYGQTLWLEDLDSSNGTYLNNQRVFGRVPLQVGDELRLGGTLWRLMAA